MINIADEHGGYDREAAERHIAGIYDTTLRVFELAERDGITTAEAADRYAEERIEAARAAGRRPQPS